MTFAELENLARIGKLKKEPPLLREYEGLLRSADSRLADAENESNSLESRFDLAYGASHALALAALRRAGYRSENRALVFQTLPATLGIENAVWRVLATARASGRPRRGTGRRSSGVRKVYERISSRFTRRLPSLRRPRPAGRRRRRPPGRSPAWGNSAD